MKVWYSLRSLPEATPLRGRAIKALSWTKEENDTPRVNAFLSNNPERRVHYPLTLVDMDVKGIRWPRRYHYDSENFPFDSAPRRMASSNLPGSNLVNSWSTFTDIFFWPQSIHAA